MNRKSWLMKLREEWARLQNRDFEKRGLDVRVSHESYAAQGIDQEPTKHLGPSVIALESQGIRTDRGDEHRKIINRNRERIMKRDKCRERNREYVRSR